MNQIKSIIEWCKQNPVTVASALVVVLAGLSFLWPTMAWSSEFKRELSGRSSDLSRLNELSSTRITVPPPEADGEPIQETTTVNDKRIEALKKFYDNIETEYQNVRDFVVHYNQFGSEERPNEHKPMIEGLFPEPKTSNALFNAQKAYVQAIRELYEALDASDTMTAEEMKELIQKEQDRYRASLFRPATGPDALTDAEVAEGNRLVAERVQRIIKERALEHHIYAPAVKLDLQGNEADQRPGPFQVDPWVWQGGRLKTESIWEGQMQLWIQQDLVQALRIANRMDDPRASVIDQPVKVLKEIRVLPGYIGADEPSRSTSGGGGGGGEFASSAPAAVDDAAKEAALREGLKPDPAYLTGRKSNALYDVRHATMNVIIDYTRIPELLNAIAQVNFMSVIDLQMYDVDEYQMFRDGYFFGNAVDAVELVLTIETIWMRDWTAGTYMTAEQIKEAEAQREKVNKGLMPDSVRLRLNLPLRGSVDAALEQQDSGAGSTMSPASGGRGPGGLGPGRGGF
ncbi:MAG TPA: hypothetical protein VM328_04555 [Fimbriimonadaceae bacterium]|nr:hypothetical protein [Fimbriimonadaceae bacterium]